MSYNVIPTEKFKKEAKKLKKKYSSLPDELSKLNEKLTSNPTLGTSVGNNTYKIRMAIKSKGKGKSGGARVITYFVSADDEIYLLTIYDKSEMENIDDSIIARIIETLQSKLK